MLGFAVAKVVVVVAVVTGLVTTSVFIVNAAARLGIPGVLPSKRRKFNGISSTGPE